MFNNCVENKFYNLDLHTNKYKYYEKKKISLLFVYDDIGWFLCLARKTKFLFV